MSTLYQDLDFTNFPNALDNIQLKSNITNSTDAQLVERIQSSIVIGDFSTAASILAANPQLNGKIFNANDYNQIRDAILALERFYKNDINNYIQQKQTEWESNVDRFSFKGVYSPSTQYYQNNLVNYTSATGTFLYLCLQTPPVGTSPANTTYWNQLTLRGERGISGESLSFTYVWDTTTQYNVNDVVEYDGKWWNATQINRGQIPTEGSQYWNLMMTALPALQIPVSENQPESQVLGDQWYQVI